MCGPAISFGYCKECKHGNHCDLNNPINVYKITIGERQDSYIDFCLCESCFRKLSDILVFDFDYGNKSNVLEIREFGR